MSGRNTHHLIISVATLLISCMLLMTSVVTTGARSTYDTITVFGSGEGIIDINFTEWAGGYDNTSLSVRLPKWSSINSAEFELTGSSHDGETTTVAVDATELDRGTQTPPDQLTQDRWGIHLDVNTIGLFGTPDVKKDYNYMNMSSVDTADIYGKGMNDTIVSDPERGMAIITSLSGSGSSSYFFYATGRPIVTKIGQLNTDTDALPDFAMGMEEGKEVVVWLRRTGSVWFDRRQNVSVGMPVRDLVIADVTNDGREDLVVAAGDGHALVLMQDPDGNFTKVFEQDLSSGGLPGHVYRIRGCAVGDLDGDGLNDTAWTLSTANTTGYDEGAGLVTVCYQDPSRENITANGSRTRYAYTAAWGIDAGDVNGDGLDDIVVTNRGSSDNLHILYQDSQGNISEAKGIPCRVTKQGWPDVGDLNGDGDADIAVGGWDNNLSVLMQWKGEINGSIWNVTTTHPINRVSLADVKYAGEVDLVTADTTGKSYTFYIQDDQFYADWISRPLVQPVPFDDVTVDYAIESGGGTTRVYFSWDNTSWSYVTSGARFTSPSRPTEFWLRVWTRAPVVSDMDIIRYINANLTPRTYPTDLGLDVGIDGTVDWNLSGELDSTTRAWGIETAMTSYLQDPDVTPDVEGMVMVPLGIRTMAAGNLRVHGLKVEYNNASTRPQLDLPGDGLLTNATPVFKFRADDNNGDDLAYVVQLTTTDFDDYLNTSTFDMRVSLYDQDAGEGFSAGSYAPGAMATFVLPARYALGDAITYSWRVIGYDGRITGEPSEARSFKVDALLPRTMMTSPEYSTQLDFTVNWTAWDPSPGSGLRTEETFDVQYRRSTEPTWTPWLTGTTDTRATFHGEEGTIYHFRMRAWDNVGNAGSLSGGVGDTTTRVDTIDPTLSVVSPLEGEVVTDHSLELRLDARDGAFTLSDGMVEYRRDGLAWGTMTRSFSDPGVWEVTLLTDNMDDGDHTVTFRATDDVGHAVQVSRDFVIDNNVPICALVTPIMDAMIVGPLHVKVDARDGLGIDRVEVRVSGLPGVASTFTVYNASSGYWEASLGTSGMDEGRIQLSALAWDTSGLVSEEAGPLSLRVDNTPPRLEITEPADGAHIEGEAELVRVRISDLYFDTSVDVVRVSFDGGGWTDMTYDRLQFTILWDMTGLPDGKHTISAAATDAAGLTTEVMAVVHIDNTAPVITFIDPVEGQVLSGLVTLDARVVDLYLDKVQADVDGNLWTNIIDQPIVIDTREYEDGTHTINVWAVDTLDHEVEASIRVVFDNTPPTLTAVEVPPQGARVAGDVLFVLSVADAHGLASLAVEVDGAVVDPSPVETGGTIRWTFPSGACADGGHTVTVTAMDITSNAANLTWTGIVDNSPPAVELRSPGDRAEGVVRFVVEVADPSGVASVHLRLGEGEWVMMVEEGEGVFVHEWTTDAGDNQDLSYTVRATDGLGNAGETVRKVEIANFNVMAALVVLAVVAAAFAVAVLLYTRRGRNR